MLELSGEAGSFADSIIESYHYAVELDLIFAKAQVAYKMKAVVPQVGEDGKIALHAARHPLIAKEKVVPTDITLGVEFDTLIITGPNTGGKTVALKTIGLLTLMAMCGLMIPAGEGSRVAVFRHILADIGDEQSIEQSLSTFSSHMVNIIHIFEVAGNSSLILLDELGAGTDPVEGAALAEAIIQELRGRGVRLACTTHYAELKAYAIQTPGVENGSCEFDVATLRPTYRLLIGVPGKSNAFAITQRLGMDTAIVDRARELVSREGNAFEQVVGRLEEDRRKMEDELEALRASAAQAKANAEASQRLKDEAEAQAKKEIDRARQEAAQIVQKTRQRADALVGELEELRRQKNKQLSAEQKARLRSGLKELESSSDPVHQRRDDNYVLPRPLVVGDEVLLYDIDKEATVLELPKDGTVLVQAGIIKTRVPLEQRPPAEQAPAEKEEPHPHGDQERLHAGDILQPGLAGPDCGRGPDGGGQLPGPGQPDAPLPGDHHPRQGHGGPADGGAAAPAPVLPGEELPPGHLWRRRKRRHHRGAEIRTGEYFQIVKKPGPPLQQGRFCIRIVVSLDERCPYKRGGIP